MGAWDMWMGISVSCFVSRESKCDVCDGVIGSKSGNMRRKGMVDGHIDRPGGARGLRGGQFSTIGQAPWAAEENQLPHLLHLRVTQRSNAPDTESSNRNI